MKRFRVVYTPPSHEQIMDISIIHAESHAEAAVKWCEKCDAESDMKDIANGINVGLFVFELDESDEKVGEARAFSVAGKMIPSYVATEITADMVEAVR